MKIEEIIKRPINSYLRLERYINDGSPSGFTINTTKNDTSPKSNNQFFSLKVLKFKKKLEYIEVGNKSSFFSSDLMIVHPDMLENKILNKFKYDIIDEIHVAPTASGRTVFCIEDKYFIKLAYLDYLGRIIRHMQLDKIQSAYEVTNQLIKVAENPNTNKKFSFLREDSGRVVKIPLDDIKINENDKIPQNCIKNNAYEWGILFREFKPYPYISETEYLIPFFSLFSKEYLPEKNEINDKHELIIIQLFKKQTKNIYDFLLDDILFPLFNTYFDALIYGGIELEAHAQNMLISIGDDYKIKRIVCRDLESAGRDIDLMEKLGIQYKTNVTGYKFNYRKPKDENQKYDKYTITHSFMFDFKLGEYIVTPLINAVKHIYNDLDIEFIRMKIKEFNAKFIEKLPEDFFPSDWCTYDSINFEKTNTERIYIWHDNPKYR